MMMKFYRRKYIIEIYKAEQIFFNKAMKRHNMDG